MQKTLKKLNLANILKAFLIIRFFIIIPLILCNCGRKSPPSNPDDYARPSFENYSDNLPEISDGKTK